MNNLKYSFTLILLIFSIFFLSSVPSFFFLIKKEERKEISLKKISFYSIQKDYKFSDFDWLIQHYSEKYKINKNLLKAIAEVETKSQNLIGDKHLKNKAYGYFQLRQPAIEQVNKIYKLNKVKYASEILNNLDFQIEYATLFIKYLLEVTDNEKEAISAYNIGLSNVKKGKFGNYYKKIIKELKKLEGKSD